MATRPESGAEEVNRELSTRDKVLRGTYAGITSITAGAAVSIVAQAPNKTWVILGGGALLLLAVSEFHDLRESAGDAE
jgi:hypothetical protein